MSGLPQTLSGPETTLPASEEAPSQESFPTPATITRDNLGRFVKGVSGNPKGKPLGTKHRISFIKHAIEEALVRDLAEDAAAIMAKALDQAKAGDTDMIKFVLGDLLKDVRKGGVEDEDNLRGAKIVQVSITQYVGQAKAAPEDAVDGEYEPLEHP